MQRAEGSGLTRTFRALRVPNYRLFWTGQLVSQTGTWMQNTALAWFVLHVTKSPLAFGTLTTVQLLPMLLLPLFGGVLADRFPKRQLLLVTQTVMLLAALLLAVLTSAGLITLPLMYILTAATGIANAVDNPTRNAFVVEMVGPADLPNAVALNSTQFQLARTLGPALGGLGVATIGYANCFYFNAASFLAVIASLLLMRQERFFTSERPARGRALNQIGQGLRYSWTTPDIALIVIVLAVLGVFGNSLNVFVALIAKFVLHLGAAGFGFLSIPLSCGSIGATLTVAYFGTARRKTLLISATAFSVVLLGLALSSWLAVTVGILIAAGYASSVFTATANARMQLVTAPQYRGRVMSLYSLLLIGAGSIGALIAGALADAEGPQVAIAEMAFICLCGVAAGYLYSVRHCGRLLPDHALPEQAATMPAAPAGATAVPSAAAAGPVSAAEAG